MRKELPEGRLFLDFESCRVCFSARDEASDGVGAKKFLPLILVIESVRDIIIMPFFLSLVRSAS